MFCDEHAMPWGQPLLAVFGSQSWAPFGSQVAVQLDAAPLPVCVTQQTVFAGQLAAPLQESAVVMAKPPPPPAAGQLPL
jgi:hypothetical protein